MQPLRDPFVDHIMGLVELFSLPLTILPFLDRTELNLWRRRFTISDPTDALHTAVALAHGCDAIIAYDQHFEAVSDHIPYHTPEEYLARYRGQPG